MAATSSGGSVDLKQLLFDVARAIDRVLLCVGAGGTAIDIGEGNVAHAGTSGEKRRRCCGFDAVSERAPMVRPWNAPKKATM